MPKARAKEDKSREKMVQLRNFAPLSHEQLNFALELVENEINMELVQAALEVVREVASSKARPVLLARFEWFAQDPTRRDQNCFLRAAILKALQPIVRLEDIPLLEKTAHTYEFMPPGPVEVGMGLRSAALISLNEVDEVLAGYHSTALLVRLSSEHTSHMSGEPALTAARILAAQGQYLPLYAYVTLQRDKIPEVVAECLRSLIRLPASLLPGLVKQYEGSTDEIVLLGLFDLLQTHPEKSKYAKFTLDFLIETRLYNLFRYLVIGLVARQEQEALAKLLKAANSGQNKSIEKYQILNELNTLAK